MNKAKRFRMSIFVLLIILGNFFIGVTVPVVNALTSGETYNYISTIKDNIEDVKTKIEISKSDSLYLTDNAFEESVIQVNKDIEQLEVDLVVQEQKLDLGIPLSIIINNCYSDKLLEYETYMSRDETLIDINDIKDIKYTYLNADNENIEATLLTKSEIESAIKKLYLEDYYNFSIDYNNNYGTKIANYINKYQEFINLVDTKKEEINNKKDLITDYQEAQLLLENTPNMLIDDANIYELISTTIVDLENELIDITIANINSKTTNVNNINSNISNKIDTFWLNNKNYIELGLDTEISNIETSYSNLNTNLNNWFSDYDDFKNNNYDNYADKLDVNLIDYYKELIALEKSYQLLKVKTDNYLLRKPSDTENISNLYTNINEYRVYLNTNKVLNHIDGIVELLKGEDEDTIDLLINFLSIEELSKSTKSLIKNAKLSFYQLDVVDEKVFDVEIYEDYILILGIESLTKQDLLNNLDYLFNFEILEDTLNITGTSKLKLYDRDSNHLITYEIIIKDDINSDGIVNLDDITALQDKLLLNEEISEKELNRIDVNNDKIFDVLDLTELEKKLLNISNDSNTSTSCFEIVRREVENIIYYDIYLKSDGEIKGFSFDVNISEDLTFYSSEINLNGININTNSDSIKVVGLGNYKNDDLLLTISYTKNSDKELNQTTFKLINNKIVFDNYNYQENNEIINLYSNVVIVSNSNSNTTSTKTNYNSTYIEETDKDLEKEEQKENQTIAEKDNIVWSNFIKVIIIVLLGVTIIYFLNKNDNQNETEDLEKNNKK